MEILLCNFSSLDKECGLLSLILTLQLVIEEIF